jgi:hypothetical protein
LLAWGVRPPLRRLLRWVWGMVLGEQEEEKERVGNDGCGMRVEREKRGIEGRAEARAMEWGYWMGAGVGLLVSFSFSFPLFLACSVLHDGRMIQVSQESLLEVFFFFFFFFFLLISGPGWDQGSKVRRRKPKQNFRSS